MGKHFEKVLTNDNSRLTLTAANSICALATQRIAALTNYENANNYHTVMTIEGKEYASLSKPLPSNIKEILMEISRYTAVVAFLREATKAKEEKYKEIDKSDYKHPTQAPTFSTSDLQKVELKSLVDDSFGWDTLTPKELLDFTAAEALAATVGKFIHKDGKLDKLRKELPTIPPFFREKGFTKDTEIPAVVVIHPEHTDGKLDVLHEELASIHRNALKTVNYYKAHVQNITSQENSSIAAWNKAETERVNKINADIQAKFRAENEQWWREYNEGLQAFNEEKIKLKAQINQAGIHVPDNSEVWTTIQELQKVLKGEE